MRNDLIYSDLSRQAELRSVYLDARKLFLLRVKFVIKTCPLPQTSQMRGENLSRLHVFGNRHDITDALKEQACVAW